LIVLSVVLFVAMGISGATKESGKALLPSDAIGIVLSPVQGAFSWVIGNFVSCGEYIYTMAVSVEENKVLKQQIIQLEKMARDSEEYKNENDRLRQKLEDISLVSRAKCMLIYHKSIDEYEAHRYIEKRAMDERRSKREIAFDVLHEFDDE